MKAVSLSLLEMVISSAQKSAKLISEADTADMYRFVEENFSTLAISLSLLLAIELIAVALFAQA